MRCLYHFIVIILMMLFCISSVNSQEILDKQEDYFVEVEKVLSSGDENLDPSLISEHKTKLRLLQKNAQETISNAEVQKKSKKELLDALGPAPDKEKGEQESEKVTQIRKKINDEIIAIDGTIKQAQLNLTKSSELEERVIDLGEKRLKSRLVERIPSPFMPHAFLNASKQGIQFIEQTYDNPKLIALVIFLSLINLVAIPLLNLLRRKQETFTKVNLGNISHRLVVQLLFSALVVLILRLSDYNDQQYAEFRHLSQAIASILLSISLYEFLHKINFINTDDNLDVNNHSHTFWNSLKNKVKYIFLLFIPLAMIGFTEFSSYFVFNIFAIILSVIFFLLSRHLITSLLYLIEISRKNPMYKSRQEFTESAPIILLIEPIIGLLTTLFALFFWGLDPSELRNIADKYSSGITIGKLTLDFNDLWAALFSFFLMYVVFRILSWFLSVRVFPKTSLDVGIVNTVLTLLRYFGITLAIISACGALGFDASSLAIVAGALSVGIGFGLQAIFSNFVSGLIILFERPFKVGDWVKVGEFEGVIKKISVRATEIETFQRASVIVPNSQMISDVVTNRTLHNTLGRVEILFGVAYDTEIENLKTLVMDLITKHRAILKYPEPQIIFMNFGESSLDFEIRCFINNVHDLLKVASELRFLIHQLFLENQIKIPFPQRDIHIKTTDFKNAMSSVSNVPESQTIDNDGYDTL